MSALDTFQRIGSAAGAANQVEDGVPTVQVPRPMLERLLAQISFNIKNKTADTEALQRELSVLIRSGS